MVEDVKALMGMQKKAMYDTEEELEENYRESPRRSSINSSISQSATRDNSAQPIKITTKPRLNKLINKVNSYIFRLKWL